MNRLAGLTLLVSGVLYSFASIAQAQGVLLARSEQGVPLLAQDLCHRVFVPLIAPYLVYFDGIQGFKNRYSIFSIIILWATNQIIQRTGIKIYNVSAHHQSGFVLFKN